MRVLFDCLLPQKNEEDVSNNPDQIILEDVDIEAIFELIKYHYKKGCRHNNSPEFCQELLRLYFMRVS